MSFQGYMRSIKTLTGKDPEDFQSLAEKKGLILNGEVKAGEIVKWLKDDFNLGHGHAMSIYAWLKGKRD
jgi:hypothetical protein